MDGKSATNLGSCLTLIWEPGLGVEIGWNVSGIRVVFLMVWVRDIGGEEAMVLTSDFKRGVDARRVVPFEDDEDGVLATIVGERGCWEESGGSVSRLRFLSELGVAWFSLSFSGQYVSRSGEVPPIGGAHDDDAGTS